MTCERFRQILPEMPEVVRNAEQEAHIRTCSECSDLISDIEFITRQAPLLQVDVDPSPRVWNSLEVVLQSEGLIRRPELVPAPAAGFWHWRPAQVMLAAAAVILLVFGAFMHQRSAAPPVVVIHPPDPVVVARNDHRGPVAPEDQQLLEAVSSRTPAMRAAYEANLQDVNEYIRDAEESARRDPNDEDAQEYLMDAYQQRSVVYQMALDRSLP